jgi:hypothetical protein
MTEKYTSLEHSIRTIMEGRSDKEQPKSLEQAIIEGGHTVEQTAEERIDEAAPAVAVAVPLIRTGIQWAGKEIAKRFFKSQAGNIAKGGAVVAAADAAISGKATDEKDYDPVAGLRADPVPGVEADELVGAPPNIDFVEPKGKNALPPASSIPVANAPAITGAPPAEAKGKTAMPPLAALVSTTKVKTDAAAMAAAAAPAAPKKEDKGRRRGLGLPGFTFNVDRGTPSAAGQASGVGTYMHKAKNPLSVKEENEADEERFKIQNVSRLNARRDKAVKQQEIQKKILDEKRSLADTVRRNVEETRKTEKAESPIITDPKLKRPDPEGSN